MIIYPLCEEKNQILNHLYKDLNSHFLGIADIFFRNSVVDSLVFDINSLVG